MRQRRPFGRHTMYLHTAKMLHIHYNHLRSLSRSFACSATVLGMAWDAYQSLKKQMTQTNQLATQHGWAWKQRQHMCSETHTNLGLKYCSVLFRCRLINLRTKRLKPTVYNQRKKINKGISCSFLMGNITERGSTCPQKLCHYQSPGASVLF